MSRKFIMIDEGFVCAYCGKTVLPIGYTARDHCPNCLRSKHVDINPGDRNATCGGMMMPVAIEKCQKGIKLVYSCQRCGMIKKNIAARDDDMELIIKISSGTCI